MDSLLLQEVFIFRRSSCLGVLHSLQRLVKRTWMGLRPMHRRRYLILRSLALHQGIRLGLQPRLV